MENIEKLSKLFHIVFVELSLIGFVACSLAITAVNYFIYDLKDESYYLPSKVMYVRCKQMPLISALIDFVSLL